MKKKWIIFAAILIVIGVSALSAHDSNERQNEATEEILNKATQVDKVTITHNKEHITLKGEEAKPFIEETPLVHIEKYERNDRKLFAKDPTYTIQYFVEGKELYSVKLLAMESKPSDDHLNDFLINEQFLVKWGDYQMMFSQNEKVEAAITYYQEQKK